MTLFIIYQRRKYGREGLGGVETSWEDVVERFDDKLPYQVDSPPVGSVRERALKRIDELLDDDNVMEIYGPLVDIKWT